LVLEEALLERVDYISLFTRRKKKSLNSSTVNIPQKDSRIHYKMNQRLPPELVDQIAFIYLLKKDPDYLNF
jgi:hypothetical protein